MLFMNSPFINSLRVGRKPDPILSSRAGLDGFRKGHMAKFRPLRFQAKFASRSGGSFAHSAEKASELVLYHSLPLNVSCRWVAWALPVLKQKMMPISGRQ